MNYTTNYHLPQWVESDRIMMGDFNDAMDTLDAGLAAAQAVADAAYCPTNKSYAVGTYTGNYTTQTITLGFRPSLVIITGDNSDSTASGHYYDLGETFGIVTASHTYGTVTLTDTGFQVVRDGSIYPRFNENLDKYFYIAFR